MVKKKINIWDIIAWIVLAGILVWILLKTFGIINTPIIVEYAPYFGAVYLAGWAMHKLEIVVGEVKELDKFRQETIKQINEIKVNYIKTHNEK